MKAIIIKAIQYTFLLQLVHFYERTSFIKERLYVTVRVLVMCVYSSMRRAEQWWWVREWVTGCCFQVKVITLWLNACVKSSFWIVSEISQLPDNILEIPQYVFYSTSCCFLDFTRSYVLAPSNVAKFTPDVANCVFCSSSLRCKFLTKGKNQSKYSVKQFFCCVSWQVTDVVRPLWSLAFVLAV